MPNPTIHPTPDGHVEIRVDGHQVAVLPDRDAETLGQALADLYGLVAETPAAAGSGIACAVCAGPIEYIDRHPDGRVGGWRHLTREPGEVHSAGPGTGDIHGQEPGMPFEVAHRDYPGSIVAETSGLGGAGQPAAPDGAA